MRSSRPSWRSVPGGLALLAILAAVVGGCGGGASAAPTTAAPTVTEAWVRVPAGGTTAAYFTISTTGAADALLSVTSPASSGCTLHETTTDSSGMAGMHPIARLEVPANGTVKLAPGGYHLMMAGVGSLTAGQHVELDLRFENAGTVKVMAEVRAG